MEIKVFLRDGCPYCEGAKQWFAKHNLAVNYTVINDSWERQRFYDQQSRELGKRISTVPQIFVDGQHIGGFSDLQVSEFARLVKNGLVK